MKYVTIIDIAKELGISKSTVSRALAGDSHNVNAETMRRIVEVADRMGYQRNELAVNLRRQHTQTIGILIPEVVTTFFMNFIEHAQRLLRKDGYRVIVAISNEDPEQERENLRMMEQCRVDGILMSVCHHEANIDCYQRMIRKGIPITFFDRAVEGVEASRVAVDDYIMSFLLVEALIRKGRRRIVHLAGPKHVRNAVARLQAYRDALRKFGMEVDERYIVAGGLNAEEGAAAMRRFVEGGLPFDALFGFTEMATLGAKSLLQQLGYRIPEEVALCCMSGTTLCTLVHPELTAVEQPVYAMAETACRLLIRLIAHPDTPKEEVILRGNLCFRAST